MSLSPVKIIISANAGTTIGNEDKVRELLNRTFSENGIDVDISLAQSGADLAELALDAARGPHSVIVAGGGDGTISTVAAAVVDSDKTLGVLPLGTLNHFARDLRIPSDLQAAADTILAGHTMKVDVAEVNNRFFLN